MTGKELSVWVVDDDASVRWVLERALANEGINTRVFDSADALFDALREAAPDVLISDVRMPGTDGLEAMHRLAREGFSFPVIVITGHGDVEACRRAFQRGAVDFLTKPVDEQALIDAVNLALEHLDQALAAARGQSDRHALVDRLSQREREILDAIARGLTSKEIARDLGISPRTVDTHRAHLAENLGTTSVAEMVRIVLEAPDR